MKTTKQYWVYILHCSNDTYYTGYTTNLTQRYEAHLNGTASKYTRSFKPLKIAQCWEVDSKSLAMRLEAYIKTLTRENKEKLILNPLKIVEKANEVFNTAQPVNQDADLVK